MIWQLYSNHESRKGFRQRERERGERAFIHARFRSFEIWHGSFLQNGRAAAVQAAAPTRTSLAQFVIHDSVVTVNRGVRIQITHVSAKG